MIIKSEGNSPDSVRVPLYDFHVIDSRCDCIEVYFTGNNYNASTVVYYVSMSVLINESACELRIYGVSLPKK